MRSVRVLPGVLTVSAWLALGAAARAEEVVHIVRENAAPAVERLILPVNRSLLVTTPVPMAEVMVANPDIADVHAHNPTALTVVGRKLGHTSVRVLQLGGAPLRELDVNVVYDLPALRRALKQAVPADAVGAEMAGASIALTGTAGSAASAERAMQAAREFIRQSGEQEPNIVSLVQIVPALPPMPLPAAPASRMETFFLEALAGKKSAAPSAEGPVGFMLD